MTRSTVKSLTKPLDEPEREFQRLRKAAMHSHQNESLDIAGRNLFDDQASFSNNNGAKMPTPPKTLHKHSSLNSSSFQNPFTIPTKQTGRIVDSQAYVRYQDDLWDEQSPSMNVSSISEAMQPTLRGGSHEADEREQNNSSEQGNNKHKEKGEDDPEWIVRSKFEDKLAKFMLEKKSRAKRIGVMLVQHRKELREQYS
ncbi:hypothetical protein Tco_0512292 [Tanacetum coccineum]